MTSMKRSCRACGMDYEQLLSCDTEGLCMECVNKNDFDCATLRKVERTEYGYWNDRVNKHKKLIFGAILGCLFKHKTQYIDLDNMRFKIAPWPLDEEIEEHGPD